MYFPCFWLTGWYEIQPFCRYIHIGRRAKKVQHQSMLYLRLTPEREVRIKDYFPLLKGLFFDFRDKNASKKE